MLDDATVKKIKDHYMKGQGSIQDIARVYRCTVDEVLKILNMEDLMTVTTPGDMIDQDEAGNEPVNYQGTTHRARYDLT